MLLCSTITVLRFSCPPVKVEKEVNPDLKVRVLQHSFSLSTRLLRRRFKRASSNWPKTERKAKNFKAHK